MQPIIIEQTEQNNFQEVCIIDLRKTKPVIFKAYPHQEEAFDKLNSHFGKNVSVKSNIHTAGLLVMPTGSGKTATGVAWMLKDMVKNGYMVLWIAHRHQLIEQAAKTVVDFSTLAINKQENFDKLQIRCISGVHGTVSTAGPSNNIIIASIQSLIRNIDRLDFILSGLKDNKLLVVVDEAHHTPAASYLEVLKKIKRICPGYNLLGLTATPTRMVEDEKKTLDSIYSSKCIHSVSMSELITSGFLATPVFKTIKTNEKFEAKFSNDDVKHLNKFGELSERVKGVIAEAKKRNKVILDEYTKNHEKYGKTLIFAINQIHCETLANELQENKELKKKGIKCDYIISGRKDNKEVIDRFIKGEIQVLVNVEIMTEGTDVPDIQTVFLTRPTKSDTLVMQMIGRGMRGIVAGGTKEVFIVDFEDTWDKFKGWLNPEIVMEVNPPPPIIPPTGGKQGGGTVHIPWEIINQIYTSTIISIIGGELKTLDILPHGWYSALDENDEEYRIMVFDNQLEGYGRIEAELKTVMQSKINPQRLLDGYFSCINDPRPDLRDLSLLIKAINIGKSMPPYYTFVERDKLDVRKIAQDIIDRDMRRSEINKHLKELYDDNLILQQVFPTYNDFKSALERQIGILEDPEAPKTDAESHPVFFTPKKQILKPGPYYDLAGLYKKVVSERFKGKLNPPSSIRWSERPMKNCWGFFRFNDRAVIINPLLNSPDVPQEVLEFVIYHELLHADMNIRHTKDFYIREHLFPNWSKHDNFLDTIEEKYKFQ